MEEDKRMIPEERKDISKHIRVIKEMEMISENECEKVEKVVHFTFQVKVQVEKEKLPVVKQGSLNVDIETKNKIGGI